MSRFNITQTNCLHSNNEIPLLCSLLLSFSTFNCNTSIMSHTLFIIVLYPFSHFYYAVLSHSVVSDSGTPRTVACEASLPMGILQTRILEWTSIPYVFSSLTVTHMYIQIPESIEDFFFIVEVESFSRICVRIDSFALICLFTQWGSFHSYIQLFFSYCKTFLDYRFKILLFFLHGLVLCKYYCFFFVLYFHPILDFPLSRFHSLGYFLDFFQ